MSKGTIVLQIHKDLVAGNLQLPALPEVCLNIKNEASNPDTDISRLSKIAQSDPAFCGYLVNVANSPIYRRISGISNVQQAVSRLGIQTTRNMAMTYAVRTLFKFRHKAIAKWLEKIWGQSTYCAAIAYVLAKHLKGNFDPDEAILASLFQDIGCLPLLDKATQYPELLSEDDAISQLITKYSRSIGAAVLRHWGMTEQFQEVARSREDWLRVHSGSADLTDLIVIARLYSYIGSAQMKELPRINEIPAYFKLGLESQLTAENTLTIVEEARELISETKSALSAAA